MGAGIIQFDFGYQRESVHLRAVPSRTALQAFVDVIKQYSHAGVRKIAYIETVYLNESGVDLTSQDVDSVMLVQLEYFDADAQLRTTTFPIPAPDWSKLEFVENRGYRLPQSHGDLLAQAYSALTGQDFTFRDGWVIA